ncbi:MAG: DUF423 domain-containing protein [Bacteroidia bacterium]
MTNKNNILSKIYIACISGALSIILGAFSAHGLENLVKQNILSLHYFEVFEKAVRYQMYHSIVLLILVLTNFITSQNIFKASFYTLLIGMILFSGSLYWIALQSIIHIDFPKYLFWITPLGGILMITGWIWIIVDIRKIIR